MKKAKPLVALKNLYIHKANNVDSKEYDNDRSNFSKNALIGDKILTQKSNGRAHGDKNNREPEHEH